MGCKAKGGEDHGGFPASAKCASSFQKLGAALLPQSPQAVRRWIAGRLPLPPKIPKTKDSQNPPTEPEAAA